MYVFSFFREFAPALHLAISEDLRNWTEVTDEEPILEPMVGGKYWRDPFILRAEDGIFHLLCTDGWESPDIAHATSTNLVDWSPQEILPVMRSIPGAKNAWAPEACYDHQQGVYWLFWSSTVPSAFPDHPNKPKDYRNHRIYGCSTKDFKTYSPTQLFFDPGFNCIDASIGYANGMYLMAFKDERGDNPYFPDEAARKHILITTAPSLTGSWTPSTYREDLGLDLAGASNKKDWWTEGPSVFWDPKGHEWWIFYEYFRSHRYGAIKSADGRHWTNMDDALHFPEGVKHGTVFWVEDPAICEQLRTFRK
jgi:beta-xylosidase